jgi:acyl-CoA synthetase (AMP-forming)/AMP-acid ligase II
VQTFWQLMTEAAARAPSRVVLADDHGRSLTTSQLCAAAEQVAAGLGVQPGTVVSWQLPTTIEAIVILAALARAGAVQNPIIPILREREVGLITRTVETELFITAETWGGFDHAGMARDLGLHVISIEMEVRVDSDLRLPMADPSGLPDPPRSSTERRWLYFSSGTTADPKGACHSDETIMASARGMNEHLGFGDGDVYPIAFPITHIGGMTMTTAALVGGGRLVLLDSWDPGSTPERAAVHRPTILGSAQPFFRAFLDAQRRHGDKPLFPALRIFAAGGAPTPPELIHELVEVFDVPGVVNSWGLTEFPVATCSTPGDSARVLAETVGRACPGVSIRRVDGELRLKGAQCFLGYVDPAGDAAAFDDEGWFRTGDLGEIDPDGNVRITGRMKDVIIRNAENISALELEDVLLRHAGVADVAVVGLPDTRTGERVCAVVVPEPGHAITLRELAEHCRVEGVARQKWPEQVQLVDVLPRNAMGKILKQALRNRLIGYNI